LRPSLVSPWSIGPPAGRALRFARETNRLPRQDPTFAVNPRWSIASGDRLPHHVEGISGMGRKQVWQPEWFRWAATILDSGSILNLAHSRMWGSCQLADGRIVFVAADRTWRVCERKRIVSRGEGPESLGFYLLATTDRLGSTVRQSRRVRQIATSVGRTYCDATDTDARQPSVDPDRATYLTDDSSN
jgi:hypothetical protein